MLTLSTKGRYATRIIIFLALHVSKGSIRKSEIAKAEEISPDYIEQILIRLKSAGLVESRRGVSGGFLLARDPAAITVLDILEAVEGTITLVADGKVNRSRASLAVTHDVWAGATTKLRSFFAGITVRALAEKTASLTDSTSFTFHI
jgi:Rrf2 family protein